MADKESEKERLVREAEEKTERQLKSGKVEGINNLPAGVGGYSTLAKELQELREAKAAKAKAAEEASEEHETDSKKAGRGEAQAERAKSEEEKLQEETWFFERPVARRLGHWYVMFRFLFIIFVLLPALIRFVDALIGTIIATIFTAGFILELIGKNRMNVRKWTYSATAIFLIYWASQDFIITLLIGFIIVGTFYARYLRKKGSKWSRFWIVVIFVLIAIIIISFTSNVLTGTQGRSLGQIYSDFFAEGGDSPLRKQFSQEFNSITALLKGEYNADQQAWDTRQVRDTYVVPEDAGVVFSDIGPSRSRFIYPDRFEITGDVQIVSLFEGGDDVDFSTPVTINVRLPICQDPDDISGLAAQSLSRTLSVLTLEQIEDLCDPWACDIPGEDPVEGQSNTFTATKAYNRFFTCGLDSVRMAPGSDDVLLNPRVMWTYTTQAVSGRQIFVAHPDTLARIENLRTHYNIPQASFDPWSINDGNVDFGVGFDRDIQFLRAEGPGDVVDSEGNPVEERFTSYFLGISLKNDGTGDVTKIRELQLELPHDEDILYINNRGGTLSTDQGYEELLIDDSPISDLSSATGLSNSDSERLLKEMNRVVGFEVTISEAIDVVEGVGEIDLGFTTVELGARATSEILLGIYETDLSPENEERLFGLVNDKVRENAIEERENTISSVKTGNFVFSHTEYQNADPDTGATQPVDIFKLVDFTGTPVDLDHQLDLEALGQEIVPGGFETFYVRVSIKQAYLDNTAYQSFFAKARTTYDYQNDRRTDLRLEAPVLIGAN